MSSYNSFSLPWWLIFTHTAIKVPLCVNACNERQQMVEICYMQVLWRLCGSVRRRTCRC